MVSIVNASPTNGIVQTADGSGVIKLQSNGVATNALAWVNFNGTGTVAIRSSYNVSSITDNGTGDYTVNFATALSDANYSSNVSVSGYYGSTYFLISTIAVDTSNNVLKTSSYARFLVGNYAGSNVDTKDINVAIFGN